MSAQTTYKYSTAIGAPGGIVDLAPYAIDTYTNEENNGVMKPGLGVVIGTVAGKTMKKPVAASTADKFLGIVVNNRTHELDTDGKIAIRKNKALGVMRYGRIYGRVKAGVTIAFNDKVYLIVNGDDAGCFTNVATDNVAINARFLGAADATTLVAEIELFNQMNEPTV